MLVSPGPPRTNGCAASGGGAGRPSWIRTSRPRRSPRAFPRGRVEEILSVRRNGLSRSGLRCYNHDQLHTCLLYTSDAADDLLCVDLGGRRSIKKKRKKKKKRKE